MGLFAELKRRQVFRVTAAYLVVAWLLLQIVDVIGPILGLPAEIARYLLFLLAAGLLPAMIFAWVYEWTSDGIRRDRETARSVATDRRRRRFDRLIMAALALAVVVLLIDRFVLSDGPYPPEPATDAAVQPGQDATRPAGGPPADRRSVAVLPFVAMSNGPDDDYFADGLTEEIINALAQLPDLLVTARTSAFHFKGRNLPVDAIGEQLGVAHVVEGSVRRAGDRLRITAQLIRAADGFDLWSESYDRRTADTLLVQEDIAEKVALALDVVLDETSRERMRRAGTGNVEAFTEYQKGREIFIRAHDSDNLVSGLRQANVHFEKAIALAPEIPDAYNSINDLHTHILINNALGILDGEITTQDVRDAPAILRRNFDLAIRYARNDAQKTSTMLDRAVILGNWSGLADLTAHAMAHSGCMPSYWLQLTTIPWGTAPQAREVFRHAVECDPHRTDAWGQLARAQLWMGDFAAVEVTALEARDRIEAENGMLLAAQVLARVQSDRAEEAHQANNGRAERESQKLFNRMMIAASRGDAGRAADGQRKYLASFGPNDSASLIMEAVRGNRNEANRLARLIDGRPAGYLALMMIIPRCACGAPFDLEATPDFTARLAESGLQWPPPKPIHFPMKTW